MQSSSSLCYVYLISDIDECSSENNCDVNARCMNTIGSYNCTCKKGYQGDGRNCPGKVQSNEGFVFHDLRAHESRGVLAHLDLVVVAMLHCLDCIHRVPFVVFILVPDIDECSSENECHVNATCANTVGSYNCTCKKGYEGDGRNCSGKVQSNEGTIATDADSFVLHALRALKSLDVLKKSQSGYIGREERKSKFDVNEVLTIRKSSPIT